VLLALKLTLAPGLVAAASLVEKRFGHRLAGWTAGFPIVAGPILFLLALEQGPRFAADAARQTLLGVVSLSQYCLVYAHGSRRASPAASLLMAYTAFAAVTLVLSTVEAGHLLSLAAALVALTVARALLPTPETAATPPARPSLVLRMIATATIVLTITGLAHVLGPRWSGLLVPFPIAGTVLVVAAHRTGGHAAALRVLQGLLPALYGFSLFCAAVAWWLPSHGLPLTFGLGLVGSLACQALLLGVDARNRAA